MDNKKLNNSMSTTMVIRKRFFSEIEKAGFYHSFDQLSKFIVKQHAEIWLVGGQIRDYYLQENQFPNDFDLATNCNVAELSKYMKGSFSSKQMKFFEQFHTISFNTNDVNIDIAELRLEKFSKTSLLPKITYIENIVDDLKRRDFTMNSMAVNLLNLTEDRVIDPHSGIKAIKEKSLSVIHRKSYLDDPTRIFRAARYASRLKLAISTNEEMLIKEGMKNISLLPQYTIDKEMNLIRNDKEPQQAIELLNSWGYHLTR
ncbi:MAG: hypothetical protein CL779_01850 [Chloroflexi bacterium]|nr:hypothetical protein [Chloroflexota bacterium]|tara:strand:- start:7111 stop:7884 length:774 start_codon:yes stop_codon:yes gene_type:complete